MTDKFLKIKSIDPEYWGKSGWIFLNSIALTYEPQYKEKYRQFILQLPFILPCKTCGNNLKKNIPTLDFALESKENFINWLIDVRNGIYTDNHMEWKHKNFKQTVEEIFYSYKARTNIYIGVLFCIILLIILIFMLKKSIYENMIIE